MTKILFLGDSITDANRLWLPDECEGLGNGFVKLISDSLYQENTNIMIRNRGHDGLTLPGLIRNLERDCFSFHPDIVSVLIGINDVGVAMNTGISLKEQHFREQFEFLIQKIKNHTNARVFCMAPFIFPHPETYLNWIPETLRAEHWIREISLKYHCPFAPLQELLNKAAGEYGYDALTIDGIHPAETGKKLICNSWLSLYFQ